jgi:hypothetical protein
MNSLQQVRFDRQQNSGSQFRSRRRNCEQFQPWQLRHETNGRKWKDHCAGLVRVLNALIYIGPDRATEKEICNMCGFKGRTVRKWLRVARLRNLIADEEWVPNSRGLDHVKRALELAPLRAMRPRSNRAVSTPRIVPGLGPRIVPPKYSTKPKFKSSGVSTSFHHPETPQPKPDDEKKVYAPNPQPTQAQPETQPTRQDRLRARALRILRPRYPEASDAAFAAAFEEGYARRRGEPVSPVWYVRCFENKQIPLRPREENPVEEPVNDPNDPLLTKPELSTLLCKGYNQYWDLGQIKRMLNAQFSLPNLKHIRRSMVAEIERIFADPKARELWGAVPVEMVN